MKNNLEGLMLCIAGVSLSCLTFIIYSGSLGYEFVSDDRINIVENYRLRSLDLENVVWFFSNALGGHYQPFTWLSFMFDYALWGLDSYGYRLNNILLHSANAFLFMNAIFLVLSRFYTSISYRKIIVASSIGALFFSLHPLRVESVVWITERRDLLSAFFLLISFIFYFYSRYGIEQINNSFIKKNAYYISFLFFIFSLLSKAWAITFPIVLILIDIALEESRRVTISSVLIKIKEKAPFILCSIVFVIIGIVSAESSGAMISWEKLTVLDRVLQAAYGFNTYLWHTFYPVELSPLYLLGNTDFLSTKYIIHFIIFISVFVGAYSFRKKWPWILYLLLIYLVIISPVLGFAQSGPQIIADRYTYIALLPFSFALSWLALMSITIIFNQDNKNTLYYLSNVFLIVVLFSLLIMTSYTLTQIKIWKNEETLWSRAFQVDEKNYLAINNRADYKSRIGKYNESTGDYTLALSLNKSDAYALNGRATAKIYLGQLGSAMNDLDAALLILPTYVDAILNRGVIYNNQGNFELAKKDFEKVVELEPANEKGIFYLGIAYFSQSEFKKAIELFTQVYYLNSVYIDAIYYRGLAYSGLNNINKAIEDFEYILSNIRQESIIYKNAENQIRLLKNG